jgi:hypothetical protein
VEYGIKAASRGSPIVAVLAKNNNNNNSMNPNTPAMSNKNSMMIYILVSNSAGQVYRIDDHIFMFATGLMVSKQRFAKFLHFGFVKPFTCLPFLH